MGYPGEEFADGFSQAVPGEVRVRVAGVIGRRCNSLIGIMTGVMICVLPGAMIGRVQRGGSLLRSEGRSGKSAARLNISL